MAGWTLRDIPDLRGRRAVVTGGTTGLGREIATALAAKGASVLLTSRDAARAATVAGAIQAAHPHADVAGAGLDLGDLGSVHACAARTLAGGPLHLLVNNAGMLPPAERRTTADGFELAFGVNFIGPFALTGLLLPALEAATLARIVTVASVAHRRGRIAFDDLQTVAHYSFLDAYAQSKLADLIFALELDRRLRRRGSAIVSAAAHPGLSYTDLASTMMQGKPVALALMNAVMRVVGQSAAQGALPILQAATDPAIAGGSYTGPDRFSEYRGRPTPAKIAPHAADTVTATRLWACAEALSGIAYLDD